MGLYLQSSYDWVESLVNIILNFPLKKYGAVAYTDYAVDGATLAITAGTIVTATSSFIRQSITGFSQELQQVISYNYGSGKKDRVKKAIRFGILVSPSFFR